MAEETTVRSKKLWVVTGANILALGATGFAAWELEPEQADVISTIHGNYLTFLFLFNAAYAGINSAQKWALK